MNKTSKHPMAKEKANEQSKIPWPRKGQMIKGSKHPMVKEREIEQSQQTSHGQGKGNEQSQQTSHGQGEGK